MGEGAADAERLEEEQRLVARAHAGDMDALRPLLERYADPLWAVIRPRLADDATAEDALRETLLAAVEKIHAFRWEGKSIYFWLRQIAVNKVTDAHRSRQRAGRLALLVAEEQPAETPPEEGADEALIAAEERRLARARIDDALTAIAPRYRDAIVLRLVEERPREECAQRLGVTVPTFDVILYRAVRAFRKRYASEESEE